MGKKINLQEMEAENYRAEATQGGPKGLGIPLDWPTSSYIGIYGEFLFLFRCSPVSYL
jgi:hypothetical protein